MKSGPVAAYLRGLRGLGPLTKSTIEEFGLFPGLPPGRLSDTASPEAAFLDLVSDELEQLDPEKASLLRFALFEPGSAEERGDRYARAHRKPNSYYRLHLSAAITALAERLVDLMDAETSVATKVSAPWYEVTAAQYLLRLDPDDYRRQHWQVKLRLRVLARVQPIVEYSQGWTGVGEREGEVVVRSGPQRPTAPPHICLRTRPEDKRPFAWTLYLFDLGEPIAPGTTVTLHFCETLYDEIDRCQPFIAWNSSRYATLEEIRFTVDFGPHVPTDVRSYLETRDTKAGTGFTPTDPVTALEPVDGVVDVKWTDIDHVSRYSLIWEPIYRQSSRGVQG